MTIEPPTTMPTRVQVASWSKVVERKKTVSRLSWKTATKARGAML
jgi:hypothetical protein